MLPEDAAEMSRVDAGRGSEVLEANLFERVGTEVVDGHAQPGRGASPRRGFLAHDQCRELEGETFDHQRRYGVTRVKLGEDAQSNVGECAAVRFHGTVETRLARTELRQPLVGEFEPEDPAAGGREM